MRVFHTRLFSLGFFGGALVSLGDPAQSDIYNAHAKL